MRRCRSAPAQLSLIGRLHVQGMYALSQRSRNEGAHPFAAIVGMSGNALAEAISMRIARAGGSYSLCDIQSNAVAGRDLLVGNRAAGLRDIGRTPAAADWKPSRRIRRCRCRAGKYLPAASARSRSSGRCWKTRQPFRMGIFGVIGSPPRDPQTPRLQTRVVHALQAVKLHFTAKLPAASLP